MTAITPAGDPFLGPGEVRALARNVDWTSTSLGPVEAWSPTLRSTIRSALDSRFPINLWCGPDLVLVYNDAYTSVLGAKHPASLGQRGSAVWAEIWHSIEPLFERIRAGGPAAFEEDAPFFVERTGRSDGGRADGEPNAWFTFALSPVRDERGAIVAFMNIVSETTGRVLAERATQAARAAAERAEARLREVFVQAPAFLAVLRGSDHVFEYVNAAYYQLVGHRELLGRPVEEALPEIRGQAFPGLLDAVLATGEPYVGHEVPVHISRTPDSELEQRFVDVVYYPITEAGGERSGVVAHGSDVTEHVLARREAQRARAEAERANQAKSHFLASMSHEIRTPINGVIGYADLLDAGVTGPLTEKQHDFVRRIRASSRHLMTLVDDVLDLAKVESGEMEVALEETSLRAVVDSALDMVAPEAVNRGIALRGAWSCGESVTFLGDSDRTRQILLNLLSNALKFTEAGGSVTVRCGPPTKVTEAAELPGAGPWMRVDVEDTGTGIHEEELARIFEPFTQAQGRHPTAPGGTGLGLSISRRLARMMRGDVTVRSVHGQGSCFSLWLVPGGAEHRLPATEDWPRAEAWPASPEEVPGLDRVGRLLLARVERVEQLLVERLLADPVIPGGEGVPRARLADHTAALVALLARNLTVMDEAGGESALLEDGEDIQTLLASRHGSQRWRLGWQRADVEHEYRILHDVLDGFIRREASSSELRQPLAVVHRILDRIEGISLAAFDEAAEDGIDIPS